MARVLVIMACVAQILFSVTYADDSNFSAVRENTPRPGYIWVCGQDPVDIAFVMDASNSIWDANFTLGIKFIHDFLSRYDIAADTVHVGAILFSEGIFPDKSFGFTDYTTKSEVLEAVLALPYVGGLQTDTGLGLRYMRMVIMAEARPDVPHIAIVMTDGQSHDKRLTALEAALARAQGITMLAIGVGNDVSFQELVNIAGNPDNAFNVYNYDALQSIMDKLEYRTCVEKLKPTLPPPPPCGERNPTNVIFIFDMSSFSESSNRAVGRFISEVIGHVDMEFAMEYGVSSGNCPDDGGFDLGQYDPDVMLDRLSSVSHNRMAPLLNRANTMFTNGRSGVSEYAVVFYEQEANVNEAQTQFSNAFSDNVKVMMVVIVEEGSSPLDSVFDNVSLASGSDLSLLGQQFVEQLCAEAEAEVEAEA